jgi:hypothetical protein
MASDLTELILGRAHNAAALMDEHGSVTYWNPSAEGAFAMRGAANGHHRDAGMRGPMVRPVGVEVREETDREHQILAVEGELDLSGIVVSPNTSTAGLEACAKP